MSTGVWDLIAGFFLIAIVYMLVRPGSPAAQAVTDVSNVLASLITTATGVHPASQSNPGDFAIINPTGPISA